MLAKLVLVFALVLGGAGYLIAQQNDNEKPFVFHGDMPVDSQPIAVVVNGLVRTTTGQPLHSAVVEVQMNPDHPGPDSEKTLAVTNADGRYQVIVRGHHGTVRVRVARDGFQPAARELHFIRSNREVTYNFSLPLVRPPR
jgi:hypothetical protein